MTDSHQMYEAESGEFVLAATGDSMIARPLSSFREERFTGLIDVLRGADAAFTNLEMQIHRYEPYPAANSGGLWTAADHRCVDEGADAVLGHGPHFLRGVEVYKSRPIFYSLGNFIFQNEVMPSLPSDLYERAGLDNTATPADFYDYRSQNDTRGFPADAMFWESVVAVIHLNRNGPGEVRLHPIELGFRKPRSNRGRPVLASEDAGRRILKTLRELSEPYGTQVRLVNEIGVIDLPPAG